MSPEQIYDRSPRWAQTVLMNAHALRITAHRYGPRFRAAVRLLRDQERWPREALDRYRDERIRHVVRAAYEGSPFYRRTFDAAGIRPADVRGAADLARLPLLTRDTVREEGMELCTSLEPRRGWLAGRTSGTTGSALRLWYDRNTAIMTNAVDRRQKEWGGMRRGDWIGVFLGRPVVPVRETRPPFWRANHVHRQVWFSVFHLAGEHLDRYAAEIVRRRLRFVEGYPSALYVVATHLLRAGRTVPLQAVFTSSETLHAVQREAIEAAFACPVFDFYGHAERVIFASECEAHAGMHLAEEFGWVEVVDDQGRAVPEGEPGWLVGTSLHNTAMPMLRYRTGDISAIERGPCACGRTLARIRAVTTKAEDLLVTPDGRLVPPSALTHPFKTAVGIVKSQLVQERPGQLTVRVVSGAGFSDQEEHRLADALRARLGPGMSVEVARVADIPREASGKYRWVVSRVDHPSRIHWENPV